MIYTILIVLLVVLAIGGLPHWGYTTSYYPSGGLGLVLIAILVIMLINGGV